MATAEARVHARGFAKWGSLNSVAGSDKFGRIKQLMTVGKQKGYVLYDEVNVTIVDDECISAESGVGR